MRAGAAGGWKDLALWGAAALLLWELGSWLLLERLQVPLAQSKLPYPHRIAEALARDGGKLLAEAAATLGSAAKGFLAGALAGAALALLMGASRTAERIAAPYAVASQMIPILGLAPIVYGIFRDEGTARLLIAAYIAFFPVALQMLRGLKSIRPEDRELQRVLAAGRWFAFRTLLLPASLPGLFTGLKTAAPLAVTGAILVELMGARHGIGVLMLRYLYYGPSHAYLFWCTVLLSAALGLLAYGAVALLERLLLPWQRSGPAAAGKGAGA
ncbi:ABC transporter permease subunit [Paenibacillus sp. FSL W8-1187]|uniref:Hydroxymethylpyrimidine ABC transporter, transmembrane component n=1 Tax=Paenibacillus pasadenensis TaxID=217090 RepID=A0A2N5N6S7_9BACL|nr:MULTISPECIES: ABC transporter permease subunit [Paenibacillus]PLT46038.1 Hydroxymethylpyrimidine ABC transporter, transmembrane component [Paenibacillus pasadenensis]QGG56520.1 ABC transporter permease subunit [Paenibacillus sp. B01]